MSDTSSAEPEQHEPHRTHESPIQRIIVESALIVFSILLALAVNSYVDARKERALTERALRGVRDELTANLHGFHNPTLDGTAWQSAISLGTVAYMGYDTVRVLSSAYDFQAKADQYAAASIPTFDFADAAMPSTIRRMYVFIETMRIQEDTLADRYANALKLLDTTTTR